VSKKRISEVRMGPLWLHDLATLPDDFQDWKLTQVESLDKLAQDFVRVHRHRNMWADLSSVLEERDPRCGWTRHYDALYVDSQLLALTRICYSTQRNSVSLSELLDAFRSRPELLIHLGGYRVEAGLEKALYPKRDKAVIRAAVKKLEPWRNQFVAHISRNPRPQDFSWSDIETAITTLTQVFKLYAFRLTGVLYKVDASTSTNWHKVFAEGLYKTDT